MDEEELRNKLILAVMCKNADQVISIVKEIKSKGFNVSFKAINKKEVELAKRNSCRMMMENLIDMGYQREEIEKVSEDSDIEMAINQIEALRLNN